MATFTVMQSTKDYFMEVHKPGCRHTTAVNEVKRAQVGCGPAFDVEGESAQAVVTDYIETQNGMLGRLAPCVKRGA